MKRRNLLFMALAGIGLTGATVLQVIKASPPPANVVGTITRDDDRGHVAAEGRVITYPGAEVAVAAERQGRLVRLPVVEGQLVKKGEVLAEIDSRELRAGLAEARARVAEAEAEVRLGEVTLSRRADLVRQEVVARHALDEAERDLDVSRARLETSRAEVARYEALLEKAVVLAPLTGTIVARHRDAGETVDVSDLVVTLADLRRLRIEAEADEADASSIALGAPVVITSEGYPGASWQGIVEEIADSVTPRKLKPQDPGRPSDTRILAVKVAFSGPTPLKLGTTVELKITSAR